MSDGRGDLELDAVDGDGASAGHAKAAARGAAWRAVAALVATVMGVIIARNYPEIGVMTWCVIAGAAIVLACGVRGRVCGVALWLAMLAGFAAWTALRVHTVEVSSLARHVPDTGDQRAQVAVAGIVKSPPRVQQWPSPADAWRGTSATARASTQFTIALRQAGDIGGAMRDVTGDVWVSMTPGARTPVPSVRAGDVITIHGLLSVPEAPALPGQHDARLIAAQDGLVGWLGASSDALKIEARDDGWTDRIRASMLRAMGWWRSFAQQALDRATPDDLPGVVPDPRVQQGRAVLTALLIGQYDPEVRPIADAWSRLGLIHALSISGFHLTVMAAMVLALVRVSGDRGRMEAWLVAGVVLLYVLIVPADAPILRSAIMVLGVLLGDAFGRRYDRLSILSWIAVALLVWRPLDVLSPGFQLSFGMTAALFVLGEPARAWMFPARGVRGRARRSITRRSMVLSAVRHHLEGLASTSVMCWAIASPIVAYHFGVFSPVAIVASMVVVPVMVPTLWIGYLALVLGAVWPGAARVVGAVLDEVGVGLVRITELLDALPGAAWPVPAMPVWLALALTGVAAAWFIVRDARLWALWVATCAGGLTLAAVMAMAVRGPSTPRVDQLAIVDGSCTLVRSGADAVLVDCGSSSAGIARRLSRDVPAAVRALGGWRVSTLVLTTPTAQACAGAVEVAERLGVQDVLISPAMSALEQTNVGAPVSGVLRALRRAGANLITVREGDELRLDGGAVMRFGLSPKGDVKWSLVAK